MNSNNMIKYLQGREWGFSGKRRKSHPQDPACALSYDFAHKIAEEKATIPVKNQPCELSGQSRSTFIMTFSPDGTKIASTHGDHSVRVTDINTGKCTHILPGHPRTPWCIAFHPSSNDILASGCLGGEVRIWDLRGGGSEVWKNDKEYVIASIAFHPVNQVLVIASTNEILFWDWTQPEPFARCKTASEFERVRWVKFDPWGHYLYTGIANGSTVQSEDVSYTDMTNECVDSAERQRMRTRYSRLVREMTHRQRDRIHASLPRDRLFSQRPAPQPVSSSNQMDGLSVSGPHQVDVDLVAPLSPTHVDAISNARVYAAHVNRMANERQYGAEVTSANIGNYEDGAERAVIRVRNEHAIEQVGTSQSSTAQENPQAQGTRTNVGGTSSNGRHGNSEHDPTAPSEPEGVTAMGAEANHGGSSEIEQPSTSANGNVEKACASKTNRPSLLVEQLQALKRQREEGNVDEGGSVSSGSGGPRKKLKQGDQTAVKKDCTQGAKADGGLFGSLLRGKLSSASSVSNSTVSSRPKTVTVVSAPTSVTNARSNTSFLRSRLETPEANQELNAFYARLKARGAASASASASSTDIVSQSGSNPTESNASTSSGSQNSSGSARQQSEASTTDKLAEFYAKLKARAPPFALPSENIHTTQSAFSRSNAPNSPGRQTTNRPNQNRKLSEFYARLLSRTNTSSSPFAPHMGNTQSNALGSNVSSAPGSQSLDGSTAPPTTIVTSSSSGSSSMVIASSSETLPPTSTTLVSSAGASLPTVTTESSHLYSERTSSPPSNLGRLFFSRRRLRCARQASSPMQRSQDNRHNTATRNRSGSERESDGNSNSNSTNNLYNLRTVTQPQRLASIIESEVRQAIDRVRTRQLNIRQTLDTLDRLQEDTLVGLQTDNEPNTNSAERIDNNSTESVRVRGTSDVPSLTDTILTSESARPGLLVTSASESNNSTTTTTTTMLLNMNPTNVSQASTTEGSQGSSSASDNQDGAVRSEGENGVHSQGNSSTRLRHSNRTTESDIVWLRSQQERLRDRQVRLREEINEIRNRLGNEEETVNSPRVVPEITITRAPPVTSADTEISNLQEQVSNRQSQIENSRLELDRIRSRDRQLHQEIQQMRFDFLRNRQQRMDQERRWHHLQRRNLHPDYAISILDDTVNRPNDGLQAAINRAIAGAFMGTGEQAVAANIVDVTYRIQRWNFSQCNIPDITNSESNIIIPHCKIHNDSSSEISQDGKLLATFVPSHRGFPDDTILGVFSLAPKSLGQCLYTKSFGPNAISVSISPLNSYVLVGLAAKRLAWVFTPKQMVAQVFKLKTKEAGEDSMEHICDLMHPCEVDIRTHVSVNSARWLPRVGEGVVYGTNRGDLHICRPGVENKEQRPSSSNGERGTQESNTIRRNLMQMLGWTIPRTISTSTQTSHQVRRTASTQTDRHEAEENQD